MENIEKRVGNEIIEGSVKCSGCAVVFEIKNGILDMLYEINTGISDEIKHWDVIATDFEKHPAPLDLRDKLLANTFGLLNRTIQRYLPQKDSIVMFDLGCGASEIVDLMSSNAKEFFYIGVDVSLAMLLRASRRKKPMWKVNLVRADANKRLLTENVVDVAVSFASLHHLKVEQILSGVSASLKERSLFVLHEPSRQNLFARLGRRFIKSFYTETERPLSPFEVKKVAELYGLNLIEERGPAPLGLFYAYSVGFLGRYNSFLARAIRTFDQTVAYTDDFLQKTHLGRILSASFYQVYEKRTV